MDPQQKHDFDSPTNVPVDADEEKQRLLVHAAEHGVDATEALQLAERLAYGTTLAEAYRDVDRRVAAGYTLEEAEVILLGDVGDTRPNKAAPGGTTGQGE